MPEPDFFSRHAPKMMVAVVLTFSSGIVDIIGYLGVYQLFTAHLTGTTVQLGRSLKNHQWFQVFMAATIVGAFMVGSLLGRTLIEIASRKRFRRIASATLTLEALALIIVVRGEWASPMKLYFCMALLAAAMGIQTATLTGIGPLTVHTTFVTGMLNKIAQLVSHIAFRAYDSPKSKSQDITARRDQIQDIQITMFLLAVWFAYLAGAAFGTFSFEVWGLRALLFAAGLLAVGLATDLGWPLSCKEEAE